MPTFRIVGEPPQSVEIRNGLMLYAGVAGREEATVDATSRTSALLDAGRIIVVDPDAEPPDPDPVYDPIYVDRESGEIFRNEGGGVLEPFGDPATDIEVEAGISAHNASGVAHADIRDTLDDLSQTVESSGGGALGTSSNPVEDAEAERPDFPIVWWKTGEIPADAEPGDMRIAP